MLDLLAGFVIELRNAGLPCQPHREPRRDGGGAAHPDRGPRGVQVRARRDDGQEQQRTGARSRRCSRCTSACAVPSTASPTATTTTSTRCGARCKSRCARATARARRAAGSMESLTPEEMAQTADAGADERRPGDDAGARQAGRAALRRHGARPPGRRHVLPVPHAAQPRPRRHAREADGSQPASRSAAS